jgi:hypothetical protein
MRALSIILLSLELLFWTLSIILLCGNQDVLELSSAGE